MAIRPFAPHATVDPYPGHRRLLRRTSPYHEPDLGAWVVTRHTDIIEILRNPRSSRLPQAGLRTPSRSFLVTMTAPPNRRRALVHDR